MGIFRNILSVFSAPKVGAVTTQLAPNETDEGLLLNNLANQVPTDADFAVYQTTMPAWLRDDDTLRDEAVIFGLSASNPDDKIAIICNFFLNQTAHFELTLAQFQAKIEDKKQQIDQLQKKIDSFEALNNSQLETFSNHQIPRVVAGFGLSLAMCVGNFYLIEQSLRPIYGDSPLVAVGVFLAGMFNVFGKISVFHDLDSKVNWRRLLEEVGMPAAAALFVFAQVLQNQPIERALALLFFTFFLFLLAGKLLLGNLALMTTEIMALLKRANLRREKKVRDKQMEELKPEMSALSDQKWELTSATNKIEAELTRLNARRDMLIKLFESEFNLARTLRDQLTSQQIGQLLNQNYPDGE